MTDRETYTDEETPGEMWDDPAWLRAVTDALARGMAPAGDEMGRLCRALSGAGLPDAPPDAPAMMLDLTVTGVGRNRAEKRRNAKLAFLGRRNA